jgi:o-aminophenol oxidase
MSHPHERVRLPSPGHPLRLERSLEPFVAVLRPPTARPTGTSRAEVIEIRETTVTIHPDLPAVPVWAYAVGRRGPATTPGPLLEVRAGRAVSVRFDNRLPDPPELPFALDVAPEPQPGGPPPQNRFGVEGTAPILRAPIGWTSTHLHGAHTRPGADGWPETMVHTGQSQVCTYDNTHDNAELGLTKMAATQWYHDQAGDGGRHHVHAGLIGGYLVRHPRETELALPTSAADGELFLLVQDRNLTSDGRLRLLHKTTPNSGAFFGPLTLVDGLLWPRISLRPNVYRLRLLNGSNARTYRLHLVRMVAPSSRLSVTPAHRRLLVIGTDGGLLRAAWAPTDHDPLVLAPGERLDVLLDLTDLADGESLHLVNSAPAPFDGGPAGDLNTLLRNGDEAGRNPYPQVMRFDVRHDAATRGAPATLFRAIAHDDLNPHVPRLTLPDLLDPQQHTVLIAETEPSGQLYLHELEPHPDGGITLQLPHEPGPSSYAVVGWSPADSTPSDGRAPWYDRVGVMAELGRWQVFRFVNTTRHTRAIHLHQSQVQPLGQAAGRLDVADPDGHRRYDPTSRSTRTALLPATDPVGRRYEPTETRGWKDVVRVDPGEVVAVAIRFDRPGRYSYQAPLLERDTTATMRPFVVTVAPQARRNR